ncbi:MAG TPA: IS701 family transposase [Candidatus Saccharimonadia bacterium]|nr:IS701 family transposase [Candidatus Saccharimonadia bacterium]
MTPAWAQRQAELLRDCIVSPDVFMHMVDRLRDFVVPYQQAFETEAGKRNVHLYLQGLLSHLPRKNAEDIAALVDVERLVIQEFIGTAPWDHRPLVRVLVGQVVDRLGASDGIIAFDPSSFPKRGTHSVGVKRQWCGHRGKIDNCQVGVYMGYVTRHDHALLDFRLSLPEDWVRDEQRRQACHVPPEVRYHTRHEQCLEMLDQWRDQVPHGWVTGDDELGRHTWFRGELRERGERYVLGVPCTTTMRDLEAPSPAYQGRGRRPKAPWQSVTEWRKSLNPYAWRRFTVRDGEKGPVAIEMVKRRVQTRLERKRTGPAEWLVITRRPLADDRTWEPRASRDATDQDACYRYQYYLTPTGGSGVELTEPSLAELARVIKAGTCIEASFKRGKGEVGMDAYQVRTWQGWHHHMALSLLAVWFLIGETHRGQRLTPALTLPQVRYGLSLLLLEVYCTPGIDNICRQVQRQLLRNESARFYHHHTRKCIPLRKLRRDIQ